MGRKCVISLPISDIKLLSFMSHIVPNLNTLTSWRQGKNLSPVWNDKKQWVPNFLQIPTPRSRLKKPRRLNFKALSCTGPQAQYSIFCFFKKVFLKVGPLNHISSRTHRIWIILQKMNFYHTCYLKKFLIQKTTLNSIILISLYFTNQTSNMLFTIYNFLSTKQT